MRIFAHPLWKVRFGLRTVIVLVSLYCAWLAWRVSDARQNYLEYSGRYRVINSQINDEDRRLMIHPDVLANAQTYSSRWGWLWLDAEEMPDDLFRETSRLLRSEGRQLLRSLSGVERLKKKQIQDEFKAAEKAVEEESFKEAIRRTKEEGMSLEESMAIYDKLWTE